MPHISSRFSSACIAFIKQWQGLSLEKYRDRQGDWVIGYGHTLTPDETLTLITPEQAEAFLLDDLNSCDRLLQNYLPELNDRFQRETLIALMFSIGHQRFLSLINTGDTSHPEISGL
ncbi:endolysin [Salmonella enterica subsp. salamae]|uniref:Lysozyme n=1 Tax=Salmonella enterica subsp. salamae serovar 58:d:z6 TaxID=41517 RepID=A0A729AL37_SALER|nr:lysozyme [Salmonella enterica]EAA4438491.1 endolysin [Salmonella enterica subsp. salamae]EBI0478606.1 lysozyme [Salmonella enterica subsp. enterica serovar Braenderup]ECG1420583.1 lysozyme [Salmonella enterica subsp. salamae str. CFSAN000559]EIR0427022.1 lysozyme [Salmonella enterica subsp. enterica serovar London]HCM1931953.1 lysozyme [Salmonella enterica subsp. salamae serovar 51:c:-]HCM1994203.1 lysozyme [Salmonella enterica subsp. salamae serovar 53:z4,z24:-]HCM2003473.1 lysozyme [Sal